MKKEIRICGICNQEIKPKDDYVRLTDYRLGKFNCEGFYHTICYREKVSGGKEKQALKKVTFGLLARANKLMNRAEEQIQ